MTLLVKAALIGTGLIHLLPVIGLAGAAQLTRLYGIEVSDPTLLVLLRHRAVLFGLLGLALIAAAFVPGLQAPALVAGLVATTSFVALVWLTPGTAAALTRVVMVDLAAIALLVPALLAQWLTRATVGQ
jgi:hypothetical protein